VRWMSPDHQYVWGVYFFSADVWTFGV
nr:tyrosine kinase {catalytic domain, clone Xbtk22, subdomain VIII} [Xenopus borealis, Peptide Partial, 26 aa] [Xenopus borealis]